MRKLCVWACIAISTVTVTCADVTLVNGGTSNADINLADDFVSGTSTYAAALVMQRCISTAYGFAASNLPVFVGAGGTHSVKIQIGTHYNNFPNDMDPGGFMISVSGSNIGIASPTDQGTAIGVYYFLENYVGVRWLMPGDSWEYIPVLTGGNLVITDIPPDGVVKQAAFLSRLMSGFPNSTQSAWAYRNRMYDGIKFHHNLLNLYPASSYGAGGSKPNPDFWPTFGGTHNVLQHTDGSCDWQPRFTASSSDSNGYWPTSGFPTTSLVQEGIANIKAYFAANPTATSYSLGMNDSTSFDVPEYSTQPIQKNNSLGLPDYSHLYYNWANQVIDGVIAPADSSGLIGYGLKGYWRMEKANWHGEAGEVRDASGKGHHGQAMGNAPHCPTMTNGKIGQAVAFSSTYNEWISIPAIFGNNDFAIGNNGTISVWVYPTDTGSSLEFVLAQKGSAWADIPYALFWYHSKFYGTLANNPLCLAYSGPCTASVSINQWYHVVFTWDTTANPKKATIYLDGQSAGSVTPSFNPLSDATAGIGIGRNYTWNGYYFNGCIDEAAIWNRTLSSQEVSALYANGTGYSMVNNKNFGCLAYCNVFDPPDLNVHDRLFPFLCYDRMKWAKSNLETAGHSANAAWINRAAKIGWYDYIYGAYYCLPRVYFHKMADYYAYAVSNGVKAMYAEAYPNWGEGPKLYIALKLQWDPTLNVDTLLNEWYQLAVGGDPNAAGTAACYLKQYYALWEDFWTNRVLTSAWWTDDGQYLSYDTYGYLDKVTREDIGLSRFYLEQMVSLAKQSGTSAQQIRAGRLMNEFIFYEAAAMIYIINKETGARGSMGDDDFAELLKFIENLNTITDVIDSDPATKRIFYSDAFFQSLAIAAISQRALDSVIWSDATFRQYITAAAANGDSISLRETANTIAKTVVATALTQNPSFENGSNLWDLTWHEFGSSLGIISAADSHSGTHCVQFIGGHDANGNNGKGGPCQIISNLSGGSYTVSAWIKAKSLGGVSSPYFVFTIKALDSNGNPLCSYVSTQQWHNLPIGQWIYATFTQVVPNTILTSNDIKSIAIYPIVRNTYDSNDVIYIDDVNLFNVNAFDEGITNNGSFELGSADWTHSSNGGIDSTVAHSGACSMKFTNTTSATLAQTISVLTVPMKYSISGYVKTTQGQTNGTIRMQLNLYAADGYSLGNITSQAITPANGGGWEPVDWIFDVPLNYQGGGNITNASLVLNMSGFNGATNIWLDDISMHQVVDNVVSDVISLNANTSFEDTINSPYPWISDSQNGSFVQTGMNYLVGVKSMLFTATSADANASLYECTNISKRGKYVLSANVNYASTTYNSANITLYHTLLDAAGNILVAYSSVISAPVNQWTYLNYSKDIPTTINGTTVAQIRSEVMANSLATGDQMYFDDIRLHRVISSEDVVVNSNTSFEEGGLSPWLLWTDYGSSGCGLITPIPPDGNAHTGTSYIKFLGGHDSNGNKGKGGPYQTIMGLGGGIYTVSAWIKGTNLVNKSSTCIDLAMSALDSNKNVLATYNIAHKYHNLPEGKWIYVEFTQIVPNTILTNNDVKGIEFFLTVRDCDTPEVVYIDDVQLLERY